MNKRQFKKRLKTIAKRDTKGEKIKILYVEKKTFKKFSHPEEVYYKVAFLIDGKFDGLFCKKGYLGL